MQTEPRNNVWLRPAWALLLIAAPLGFGLYHGPAFIDDAFISFRYAAKIASGQGFVYNDTPVLGATAPLYVLALALAQMLGLGVPVAAFLIGVGSAAAAPALVWRAGSALDRPAAGLLGGLLLSLFPSWWLNGKTGMETTLAGMLVILLVLLDLRRRHLLAGMVAGMLVLTRPDAALLPLIIFFIRVIDDRRAGLVFAAAALAVTLPWVIFATVYFGSPVPLSLSAKRLIHPYPFWLGLEKLGAWFVSVTSEPSLMILMSVAFLAGAVFIVSRLRQALAPALWPVIFIVGLAATGVGSFFWYKYPALPAFFLVAGIGLEQVFNGLRAGGGNRKLKKAILALAPLLFVSAQLFGAVVWFRSGQEEKFDAKEKLLFEMGAEIRKDWGRKLTAAGVPNDKLKWPVILAGETGVLGYDLLGAEVIDSAGINSLEVYEARLDDWWTLTAEHPEYGWRERWWGSPEWVRKVIKRFRPDYIASNLDYLHLRTLGQEQDFKEKYRLVRSWTAPSGEVFVLLGRAGQAK